jgi:hypothetical protein
MSTWPSRPPPSRTSRRGSVPTSWTFLGELSAATLATTLIAAAIAARRLQRLPLGAILREQ